MFSSPVDLAPIFKRVFLFRQFTSFCVTFCYFLEVVSAGEYCDSYYDHNLKYHAGFYCENYCCGLAGDKFCCKDKIYQIKEEGLVTNSTNWPQT